MTTNNATLEMNPTDVKPAESRMLSAVAHALELEQLGISQPPGLPEAAAIREDHATATAGMRAFVRMGFRLMDVKSRLPHGEYIPWCEKFLKGLSRRHLHRAKFVAEYFSQMCPVGTFEELPPEALQLIDGTGGGQSLMAALQDFPEIIGSEADAKKACESRWERHPEERDDWEPRVLSGEMNYHRALTGMLGSSATAGKPRGDVGIFSNLNRAANLMTRHFGHYDQMTEDAQTSFLVSLTQAMEHAPQAVKTAILATLKGGDA
jgi:hypothetical protein